MRSRGPLYELMVYAEQHDQPAGTLMVRVGLGEWEPRTLDDIVATVRTGKSLTIVPVLRRHEMQALLAEAGMVVTR